MWHPIASSYLIERGVCFLALAESSFSKRLAFAYLEEIQQEFFSQYSGKIEQVSRPYHFIEFGEWTNAINSYSYNTVGMRKKCQYIQTVVIYREEI